ncbi:MAG: hypothetical protein AAB289_05625, partial [Chloroflexota bacterium]
MTPRALVAARRGLGGAAPESTHALLREVLGATAASEAWRSAAAARIEAAETDLLRQARERAGE